MRRMRSPAPLRRPWRAVVSGLLHEAARRIGGGLRSLSGDDEELRESEERLRLALEAASLGLWYQDLDTGEFVASSRASTMHGLPPGSPLDPRKALDVVQVPASPKNISRASSSTSTGWTTRASPAAVPASR